MHALALLPQKLRPRRQGKRLIAPETSKRGLVSPRYGATSNSMPLRMLSCTGSNEKKPKDKKGGSKKVPEDPEGLSYPVDGFADVLEEPSVSMTQTVYQRACAKLQLVPSKHVYQRLQQTEILLPNCFLGPSEMKAIAIALVHNNTVHTIDLHGNDLGKQGLTFIVEMLQENRSIIDLNLGYTSLKAGGAQIIARALLRNTSIVKLNLSGNDFQENDAYYISDLLEKSKTLRELNLSYNCFREDGGVFIGKALGVNSALRSLDLSWNHLRLKGAIAVCQGLQVNRGLTRLFLAWNGFGMEGCNEMSKALARNTTLIELDLSANRVNVFAFQRILNGLLRNNTLRVLKIGVNPITSDGALSILRAISEDDATALIDLDLSEVSVDGDFLELLEVVQSKRPLNVKYGVALRHDDIPRPGKQVVLDTDDPSTFLFEYMRKKNLRLIDLMHSLDKDNSFSLDREELHSGLMSNDIPLSSRSMDLMMTKLDRNKDGFVDYEELVIGLKDYMRRVSKRRKKEGKEGLGPEPIVNQLEHMKERLRMRMENSGRTKSSSNTGWKI